MYILTKIDKIVMDVHNRIIDHHDSDQMSWVDGYIDLVKKDFADSIESAEYYASDRDLNFYDKNNKLVLSFRVKTWDEPMFEDDPDGEQILRIHIEDARDR